MRGKKPSEIAKAKMITYQSENGPIEVPAEPERVVVINGAVSGAVMAMGVNIVEELIAGPKDNPQYAKYIENAEVITDEKPRANHRARARFNYCRIYR